MMDDKDLDEYHNIGKPVKWNSKFTYPKSQREIVMGRRHYAVDDQKLPSVTTILSQTQSKEKQDSLARWQSSSWQGRSNEDQGPSSFTWNSYAYPFRTLFIGRETR